MGESFAENVKKKTTRKMTTIYYKPATISNILAALIIILLGGVLLYYSWHWHQSINEQMRQNCKMCSAFQKQCLYSDKELINQEYGDGPCSDMSYYEMFWKISLGLVFMGVCLMGLGVVTIIEIMNDKHKDK